MPVINENDTVATTEIRYGDNDRLAARVATMIGADLLVLLSDIDGLYTAPPALDPKAEHIPVVERITPDIEAMAGGAASELSRGGMRTKIEAGKIATAGGTHMIIADGRAKNPLSGVGEGGRCTWFLRRPIPRPRARPGSPARSSRAARSMSMRARRARCWAGKPAAGRRPADRGRVSARRRGGDPRRDSREIGRGLVAYDAEEPRGSSAVRAARSKAFSAIPAAPR